MNPPTSRPTAVITLFVLAIAAIGVVIMSGNLLATGRVLDAREGWSETLGTFEQLMARYPATEANATALDLERHAAALGIPLAPRWLPERAPASAEAKERFAELKRAVFNDYAQPQFERERRGQVDAPPQRLVDYLDRHAADLAALSATLEHGEIPVWESDLSRLAEAPIPNLLGQIDLHKLFSAVALARLHAGDRAGALEAVETSWRLARSLRDSPVLICQLIYVAATHLQVAVLRHVPDLPDTWVQRLTEHDVRRSFLTAMKFEGWHWAWIDHRAAITAPRGQTALIERLAAPVFGPFVTLCMADLSDAWRERIAAMEQVTFLCDRDLEVEGIDLAGDVAFWNLLADNYAPNLSGAVDRVAQLELDLELLLLAARIDGLQRTTGDWPDRSPEAAVACPDDRWEFRRVGPGLEIALSREVSWPRLKVGALLPHRIELH